MAAKKITSVIVTFDDGSTWSGGWRDFQAAVLQALLLDAEVMNEAAMAKVPELLAGGGARVEIDERGDVVPAHLGMAGPGTSRQPINDHRPVDPTGAEILEMEGCPPPEPTVHDAPADHLGEEP